MHNKLLLPLPHGSAVGLVNAARLANQSVVCQSVNFRTIGANPDECHHSVTCSCRPEPRPARMRLTLLWCRRCFSSLQFKTERNNGPRVPDKKKQVQVNSCVQKINGQHPVSWAECMTCIEAEFPDPTETCKFLQSDAKRVPKSSVGKHCELVCSPF